MKWKKKVNNKIETFKKDDLIFLPLGGSGEIGMNCNLYHFNDQWLMIDLGITFKDERAESAELIMPDLNFILERKEKLSAIILTHAHEDHIGAMPYLYEELGNVPIYTTRFTASVLKRKFKNSLDIQERINFLNYNETIRIGGFDIEILALTHSIPEPNAVILKTPKGNIFHTGDWKIDPKPLVGSAIDEEKMNKIKSDGIHALVCDSTNVFNEKPSGSEDDVRENFKKIFSKYTKGKIIVTCFASNIARLETIAHVADLHKRSCVILGRSLKKIYDSALENNYLTNVSDFLGEEDGKNLFDENIVLICTGSQGEERAALSKLVNGNNSNFAVNSKDLVIFSSREIPGNEKQINNLKNKLIKIKCKFLDDTNSFVHVSGHPSQKELLRMYNWVSPDLLIPVHGEYQHLYKHADFAKKSNIVSDSILVENGDLVLLDQHKKSKILSKVFTGRKALKGNRLLPIDKKIFSDIKLINNEGYLFIVMVLDINDNLLLDPIISTITLLDEDDEAEKLKLVDSIVDIYEELIDNSNNDISLEDKIKKRIKNIIKKNFGIKPKVDMTIVRV